VPLCRLRKDTQCCSFSRTVQISPGFNPQILVIYRVNSKPWNAHYQRVIVIHFAGTEALLQSLCKSAHGVHRSANSPILKKENIDLKERKYQQSKTGHCRSGRALQGARPVVPLLSSFIRGSSNTTSAIPLLRGPHPTERRAQRAHPANTWLQKTQNI
jgi:hypothetical protein